MQIRKPFRWWLDEGLGPSKSLLLPKLSILIPCPPFLSFQRTHIGAFPCAQAHSALLCPHVIHTRTHTHTHVLGPVFFLLIQVIPRKKLFLLISIFSIFFLGWLLASGLFSKCVSVCVCPGHYFSPPTVSPPGVENPTPFGKQMAPAARLSEPQPVVRSGLAAGDCVQVSKETE